MSYEEEDTCMSYEEEDTCMSRDRHASFWCLRVGFRASGLGFRV